ncbi:(2Fe-2S)-binding protein [Halosimplex sp. J119]
MEVTTTVNGESTTIEAREDEDLASALRHNGYTGVKCGCDGGDCGASTVLVDGEATMACDLTATAAEGRTIETIAALGTQDDLHPLQQSFVDNFAVQCGFCVPGMILAAKALLDDNPDPTEAEVRAAIDDVVCRCTGYQKQVEAVLDAAARVRDGHSVATDGGAVSTSRSCDDPCRGDGRE